MGDASFVVAAAIPAYNEEATIRDVVLASLRHVDEVIVVDDGSSDQTSLRSRSAGATVIQHEQNRGKAAAIMTAFRAAADRRPDALVLLDGDGQHNPEDIPRLVEPIYSRTADVVIGSRFLDVRSPVPPYRAFGQRVLNMATQFGSGLHCSDSQCGFRAFSRRAYSTIQLQETFFFGLAVESEMLFEIGSKGMRLAEKPIYVRYDDRPRRSPVKHGLGVLYRVLIMTLDRWTQTATQHTSPETLYAKPTEANEGD